MAGEALYYGTGRRKNAVARVRLVPGTGKVTINGREALAVLRPRGAGELRAHAVQGDGHDGSLRRHRHASTAAASRASPAPCATASPAPCLSAGDYRAELKKAGYLTRDARMVERKKYGLKKARKRPQFSKR